MQDDEFTIELAFLGGGGQSLTVKDSDSVWDVKIRLSGSVDRSLKLLFQGRALPDDRTLKSLGVGPTIKGSPIVYVVQSVGAESPGGEPRRSGLRIVNLKGGEMIIPTQGSDTILKLKLALQRELRLLPALMRLIFGGVELHDEETLEFYGVSPSTSTVYLLPSPVATGEAGHVPLVEAKLPAEASVGIAGIFVGMFIERRIDSLWFLARVLKVVQEEVLRVDVQYLDDGNIERGVDWAECRHELG